MVKRKIVGALLAGMVAAGLVGCVESDGSFDVGLGTIDYYEVEVALKDGREVPCVYSSSDKKSGLSCDWEEAK